MALRLVLDRYDASAWLTATGRDGDLFRNGAGALHALESGPLHLGAHDGLLGPLDQHWDRIAAKGLAPTPLEQYARCPFQYFARHVLKLEPLRLQPLGELPAQVFGELCHAVLRRCYQQLVGMGWPQTDLSPLLLYSEIVSAADEAFTNFAVQSGTGYALTWDMARDTVIALVQALLDIDQQECRDSGYRPVEFEADAEGTLDELGPEFGSLKLKGRLDRVDRRDSPPALRIIDYKFKQSREMKGQDRDLVTAAIRGFRLQPPLYAWMKVHDQLPEQVEFRFLAPAWETPIEQSRFDSSIWRGAAAPQLRQTLRMLLDGIRHGRFFILPVSEGYCDYCDIAPACRRFHGPTWWRQHTASPAKALRRLRKQKVTNE
jgi:ATP-dependent helicase/nuclease subunit B